TVAMLATGAAHAATAESGHADPFAPILLELAVVVLAAAVGRRAAGLVGQPAVLGELVIGVVIGNIGYWLGAPLFVLLMHFDDVAKIVAVAWNSPLPVAEAAAKVLPPPTAPTAVHLFVGATLSATSVGITARVFQDLRRLQSAEARLILSAAVIDDVLGLIVLAVVAGVVATGGIHLGEVARITLLSAAF